MLQSTSRKWITRLIFSAVFLSIPTWSHATSFTFNQTFIGGEMVDGSLTFSPPPTIPLNGRFFSAFDITAFSVTTSGFDPELNFTISNLHPFSTANFTFNNGNLINFDADRPDGSDRLIFDFFQNVARHTLNIRRFKITGLIGGGGDTMGLNGIATVPATVPEPSTYLLFGSGLLGLAGYRWQQRRREGTPLG